MLRRLRYLLTVLFFIPLYSCVNAQIIVSGTVLDSSKINYVENVRVVSSGGLFAITDSLGRYSILVEETDSLTFFYNKKPTQKFAVKSISDPSRFDISLRITVKGKYQVMNEVVVFSKSHKQDSLENRSPMRTFLITKARFVNRYTGGGRADLNELISIRFREISD
jgi:hypothetical protein